MTKEDGPSTKSPSPFALASHDLPGLLITQTQLRGDNYDEWSHAIRTSLRAKKKLGILDGSVVAPSSTAADYDDRMSANSMLVSWIMNTIEPTLRSTITWRDLARSLWDDIRQRFDVVNGPRIQQLKAELHSCKQHKGMTVSDYYAKVKRLWELLDESDPVPTCECGKCTCDLANRLEKRNEDAKIHQFLMGLDDTLYENVRSTLLAAESLGNMNKVYASLIREERLRSASRTSDERPAVMGLAAQTFTGKGRGEPRLEPKSSNRLCTHCHKSGHEVDSCFQLHGFPEWWPDRSKAPGRTSGRGRSSLRPSMTRAPGRSGPTPRANAATSSQTTAAAAGSHPILGDLDKAGLLGVSEEQWQLLKNLFHGQSSSTTPTMTGMYIGHRWIIDTGASNHMTYSLSLLSDISPVECAVGLPDGTKATSVQKGNMRLAPNLVLYNVLYVPTLTCNLLSVSQLPCPIY